MSKKSTSCVNFRLKVLDVKRHDSDQTTIIGQRLDTQSGDEPLTLKVIIQGLWTQTPVERDYIVNIIDAVFNVDDHTYSIDNSSGFLVTEPDNLLICTQVASSLFCERKTWLNSVFSGQPGTNRAMLVGTLVHEVFQQGVRNMSAEHGHLVKHLDELLDNSSVMLDIWSIDVTMRDVRDEALSYFPSIKDWISRYMLNGPPYPLTNDSQLDVKILNIKDIEENVWSTKYGLKGKIDVTGNVKVHDKRTNTDATRIIPLELKTGNPNLSPSHAAQVSLYSMMIEDRYAETNQGFVIYLKNEPAMHNVQISHNIKRDLIQRRNQINHYNKSYYLGPEMLDQSRMCTNCDRLTECVLMSKLYEPGKLDDYECMRGLERKATGHLNDTFIKFFQKYHEMLVRKMAIQSSNHLTPFWTYSSRVAEAKFVGIGGVRITHSYRDVTGRTVIIFERHPKLEKLSQSGSTSSRGTSEYESTQEDSSSRSQPSSSNASQLTPAIKKCKITNYFEPAKRNVIEDMVEPFDLCLNETLSKCRLAISLDCDDHTMDSQNSSTAIAIGFMNELSKKSVTVCLYEGNLSDYKPDTIFRVDKIYRKSSNADLEKMLLNRLLTPEDDWRCDQVREFIFNPAYKVETETRVNLFVLTEGFEEIQQLEPKQQQFVVEAISTHNYCMLTEKSSPTKSDAYQVIATLTNLIHQFGRSVLIVAPTTDSLIDLMKQLQSKKIKFLLVDDAKSSKAKYTFKSCIAKVPQVKGLDINKKFDAYVVQIEKVQVVVSTYATAAEGREFIRKTFDYCIGFDCDSIELLLGLSPMFCSDRFIVVDVRDYGRPPEVYANALETDDIHLSLGDHLRSLNRHSARCGDMNGKS